ncbi:MAG: flavodoxin [Campylobacteraceae bacterium]|jgi:flavodoxin|nr:flavodoxin [Campylobacteraceae bacterium]
MQSGGKILTAYFSWSKNAKALAEQIARESGSDLFEIQCVTPYSNNYNTCVAEALRDQQTNARPALLGSVANMPQYNTLFLCYPNWWESMPMAVFTFLESYDFSGKTIYPLITHGGSRFGKSLKDMQKLCPKTIIGKGLSVSAYDTGSNDSAIVTVPNKDVSLWLRKIGISR